jgi:Glycine transporter
MAVKLLLQTLDLLGTFVFALKGGATAVKHRLDLFSVMVLAFAAGNFGGITRDVLIGAIPPRALEDWDYLGVSLVAGLVTFFGYSLVEDAMCNLGVADWKGRETIRENPRAFIDTGFTALHDVTEYWDGGLLKVFRGIVTMTPNDPSSQRLDR